jgi:hypothetical protein
MYDVGVITSRLTAASMYVTKPLLYSYMSNRVNKLDSSRDSRVLDFDLTLGTWSCRTPDLT